MPGLNLRTIRVDADEALKKAPVKMVEQFTTSPMPAAIPGSTNLPGWKPGGYCRDPVPAIPAKEAKNIPSTRLNSTGVVDPIPARSV